MSRRKDGLLTGCPHNLDRELVLPKQYRDKVSGRMTFQPGQMMSLVCKQGCEPICINIGVGFGIND